MLVGMLKVPDCCLQGKSMFVVPVRQTQLQRITNIHIAAFTACVRGRQYSNVPWCACMPNLCWFHPCLNNRDECMVVSLLGKLQTRIQTQALQNGYQRRLEGTDFASGKTSNRQWFSIIIYLSFEKNDKLVKIAEDAEVISYTHGEERGET